MLIRLTASDDIAAAIDSAPIREPLDLELASGVSRLDRTLVIPAFRRGLTVRGAADGSTVLDGGCRLTGWVRDRINGRAAWRAAVPTARSTSFSRMESARNGAGGRKTAT